MDPASGETNEMKLPRPQIETAPAGAAPEAAGQALPEQSRPATPEIASNPTNTAPVAMPSIPLPSAPTGQAAMPVPAPPAQAAPISPTASLQASDDSDLIEKEWVTKAKQIVERTRNDPRKQTEALTLVKVDYMKKRYNKSIKLNQ